MYLYGEGLVSCKNLFPIQLYIYIDNKIIIKITDSDAETQMPDNWLYIGLSDDESLNESMNFDDVIFMKECTAV